MIDIEAAFVEHFSYVYLYIRKLSHNEAIAEEITSETFFKALSAIDSFREDCDIRVWLCQIAKNCYFTHVKKLQREQPLESSDADVPDSLLSGPMEAVLSKETVTEIQRSLHGLDEPYKEVFMWRTLGELSFKQIGALFGKTENWACVTYVPFPVSWTVKMKKKQKETQDILSYHSQAAGCSDKARAKASGGRQPIEECGRTGL